MKKIILILLFFFNIILNANQIITSKHFLSFIMPCYNCAKTIRQSIDSIYEQKISIPFEIVCTDDASTDNTLDILREYERYYDNFHVYIHEKNKGGGAASNTCAINSKGDLLFRLDSDNVLAPDTIDKLVNLLDETGYDGATVQELRYHNGNFIKTHDWIYIAPDNICDLYHFVNNVINPAASGNYLYTRKSFNRAGGYPENRSGTDTFCFGFKQFATGSKIAILPNSFYWHLVNPQGYWTREEKSGTNQKIALKTFMEFSEVFSETTINRFTYLENYSDAIRNGSLTLTNPNILDFLFKGFDLEESKHYQLAAIEFEKAILAGCKSEKIKIKIQNLLQK